MSEKLLEVKNLKTYFYTDEGVVKSVDDVSFDVEKGKTLGIVGESGCGKSITSLSIMQLVETPPGKIVGGEIIYQGENLLEKNKDQMRKIRGGEIAMIFQEPMTSLNPVFTVGKQIMEALRLHTDLDKEKAKERAIEMLKLVKIPLPEKRFNEYPHQLSGGMRQRVMIAMGLICHPKLLIADEPTTALDVTIQAQILELMKKLQKTNRMGIIFITHNLGVVAEICDKVSVMYAGKIVEQGPVDDIFYAPGHPYTRGLLRSMPRVDADSYERLIPIEGTPIDMLNPPEGCPFAPRCESAMKICLQKMPPYVELGENHRSACWLCVQQQIKAQKEAAKNNNEKMEADNHE